VQKEIPQGIIELLKLVSSTTVRSSCGSVVSDVIAAASSSDSGRVLLGPIIETGALSALLQSGDAGTRSGAASALAKIGLAAKVIGREERETIELLGVGVELLCGVGDEGEGGIERGIEVLCYLCSKTGLKDIVVHGVNSNAALPKIIAAASTVTDPSARYGLACIFSLLTVSIEELRKEAFRGKDVTEEQ